MTMTHTAGWLLTTVVAATLIPFLAAPMAKAVSPSPTCSAPSELTRLDRTIVRTGARLAAGRAVRIVAFGSSSTEGVGATSPAQSYPSQLQAKLLQHFPNADIVVLNRGVGGEDVREMLDRLEKSVLAEQPDLVLWQVGTNAITGEENPADEAALVRGGLARLRAAGTEVILIDPQYVPQVIAKPGATAMVRALQTAAEDQNIGVFRRFAIMGHWRQAMRVPFEQFTWHDGLHMNDWGYGCMAELLATALADAATRSVPTASIVTPARI
jgi:lysophospholipase L1-like esterase